MESTCCAADKGTPQAEPAHRTCQGSLLCRRRVQLPGSDGGQAAELQTRTGPRKSLCIAPAKATWCAGGGFSCLVAMVDSTCQAGDEGGAQAAAEPAPDSCLAAVKALGGAARISADNRHACLAQPLVHQLLMHGQTWFLPELPGSELRHWRREAACSTRGSRQQAEIPVGDLCRQVLQAFKASAPQAGILAPQNTP